MEKKKKESPLANLAMDIFNTVKSYGMYGIIGIVTICVLYLGFIIFVYIQISSPMTTYGIVTFIQKIIGILAILFLLYFPFKLVYVFLTRWMDKKLPEEKQKAGDKKADTKNEKSELHKWPIVITLQKIAKWLFIILFIVLIILLLKWVFTGDGNLKNGVFPSIGQTLWGKKTHEAKEGALVSPGPQLNPNTQYKWDKKLEIEAERNRHEEEMVKIKQQSTTKTSSTTRTNTGMQVGTGTISGPAPDMSSANNAWNNNQTVSKNTGMQVGTGTIDSPPN